MTEKPSRHRWGDRVVFPHKTERDCINCGLVKVSRHESEGGFDRYWTEFWRGCEQVVGAGTPVCQPVGADA